MIESKNPHRKIARDPLYPDNEVYIISEGNYHCSRFFVPWWVEHYPHLVVIHLEQELDQFITEEKKHGR